MTLDSIIELKDVSKEFISYDQTNNIKSLFINIFQGGFRQIFSDRIKILHQISFKIRPGEFVGIMGKNGAGKSTLLRLIGKIYEPDQGEIHIKAKVTLLMSINAGLNFLLSGKENIFLCLALVGHNMTYIKEILPKIIEFSELGINIERPLSKYSQGMLVRLFFSTMIHSKCDVFLLDEIMAVGDLYFQNKCLKKIHHLHQQGKTFILVGHSPNEVLQNCNRCLLLNKNQLIFDGDVSTGVKMYEEICYS